MPLYTFVMEFKGGTYISQTRAPSPKRALSSWVVDLDHGKIKGLGSKGKVQLIGQLKGKDPVTVKTVLNTWCVSTFVHGNLALIHLVQTDDR